jgi:predicted Zn finger-like uncharacterized protein
MSIAVQCPGCHTGFQVPEDLQGKLIRCKSCREEFRVGGGRDEVRDDDDVDAPRRPRRKKKSAAALVLTIVGAVAALGVGAIALGGFLWGKHVDRPADQPVLKDPGVGPTLRPRGRSGGGGAGGQGNNPNAGRRNPNPGGDGNPAPQ